MMFHRKRQDRIRLPQINVSFAALVIVLGLLLDSAGALSPSQRVLSPDIKIPVAAERWSPAVERSWISYNVAKLERSSFREQHLHQEVLAALLMNTASQLPSISPCGLKVRFRDRFGDFAIGVGHPNAARRLVCLRGAVDYLLLHPISEFDFIAARKADAYWERMGFSSHTYAQQLAFLAIYRKNSPLHQIHSTGPNDLSNLSFEEFDVWLRRSREQKLITFAEKTALLVALDLPVPDPMVLRPVPSLRSPRVAAGVLFFESGEIQVPALIMVSLDLNDPNPVDRQLADRLGCISGGRSRFDAAFAGSAISAVSCNIADWFGDVWLSLAIGKSDGANDLEFCRQIQELPKDAAIATVVRGSPEGSRGLYVLLPPACDKSINATR